MKHLFPLIATCLLPGLAGAQTISGTDGVSPDVTNVLDFDATPTFVGPIANDAPEFAAGRIERVDLIGTWNSSTDTLSAGTNVNGRGLVVRNNGFSIAALGNSLDLPTAGAGVDFQLDGQHDDFGLRFIDQAAFDYDVELLNGSDLVGSGSFTYVSATGSFPVPHVHFRGALSFNRVRITFPSGTGGVGFDDLHVGTAPAGACIQTLLNGTNNAGSNGTVYFDVTTQFGASFYEIESKFLNIPGLPVNLDIYTKSGTHIGSENDPSAWTLVTRDNGYAVTAGSAQLTRVTLAGPVSLPQGTTGIALVASGGIIQAYSNGANSYATPDGRVVLRTGSSSEGLFSGNIFSPRTWNGRLCRITEGLGSIYCNSNPNSTGQTADIAAYGSPVALDNNFTLTATGAPATAFGQFLCSRTQGFVMFPGGSQGNLCLLGAIGRLVGGGVVQVGPSGGASIQADLAMLPQPTQFVVAMAGERWNFQFWFRDFVAGMQTSNYSNGLTIRFE